MSLFRYFFFALAVSYMTGGQKAAQEFTRWYVRNIIAGLICVVYAFLVIGILAAFGVDTAGVLYVFPLVIVLYVIWIIYDSMQSARSRKVDTKEFLKRANDATRRNSPSHK